MRLQLLPLRLYVGDRFVLIGALLVGPYPLELHEVLDVEAFGLEALELRLF